VVVSAYTHNVWMGVLAGMGAGMLISLVLVRTRWRAAVGETP